MIPLISLAFTILLGMLLASTKVLESDADPAEGYTEALQRFEAQQAGEQTKVTEVNSSRLMTHGEQTDKVYVLIHGWTNSPRQFVELGELLFERGNNVLILRLPYHGFLSGSVGGLRNVTPENLSAYGDQTVDIAAGLGEQVEVIDLSVGGAVTSWIAQNRPDVKRVMLIPPLFGLDHLPAFVDYFFDESLFKSAQYQSNRSRGAISGACLPGAVDARCCASDEIRRIYLQAGEQFQPGSHQYPGRDKRQ